MLKVGASVEETVYGIELQNCISCHKISIFAKIRPSASLFTDVFILLLRSCSSKPGRYSSCTKNWIWSYLIDIMKSFSVKLLVAALLVHYGFCYRSYLPIRYQMIAHLFWFLWENTQMPFVAIMFENDFRITLESKNNFPTQCFCKYVSMEAVGITDNETMYNYDKNQRSLQLRYQHASLYFSDFNYCPLTS